MIDHQAFIGGLAFQKYLVSLAACDRNALGVLGDQSLVEKGLHPVAPNRVLVVNKDELGHFNSGHEELTQRLREEEDQWRARFPNDSLPVGKLDIVVGLMDRLTSHYTRPDLLEKWSLTLWRRELLGSTGIGNGLGLLHDFQPHNTSVRTDNDGVDWWLVLFPGGVDWQALDGQPVHIMVGPVMEEEGRPGRYMDVMIGITRGLRPLTASEGFDPSTWAIRLAGLPAADAAREMNFAVVQGLSGKK